jgi:hypothetical protein
VGSAGDIFLKGVLNQSAPLLHWGDDVGVDDLTFGVEKVSGANLDDGSIGSVVLAAASTLYIGIRGNTSSFDITNSGVECKATRYLLTQPGPHAWGVAGAGNHRQFNFSGAFAGGGFSTDVVKFLIDGNLLGFDGDIDGLFGFRVDPNFITQFEAEDVALIANIDIPISSIQDNLGAFDILETAGLHIEGPMVGGVNNYAILVDAGLSKLDTLWLRGAGPHTFGATFVAQDAQFKFSGPFTVGGSDASKMQIGNTLIGVAGTQRYRGLHANSSFTTQANTDTIFNISQIDVPIPNIVNNLTGGTGIVQAAAVRIQGAPTAGNTNFALIVEAGLTELFNLDHAGTLLGFYATPGVVKPTVTGAKAGNAALTSLIAALLGQGLIADTTT